MSTESNELASGLRSDYGRDLLPAFPLIAAHLKSAALLGALQVSAAHVLAGAQDKLGREICLVAFGSLGRLEYVSGFSDLDPIIVIDGEMSPALAAKARSVILTPLATLTPWIGLDHRESIVQDRWMEIHEPDIPYPVMGTAELSSPPAELSSPPLATPDVNSQRKWQILLEGRPLSNPRLFESLYQQILPQIRIARPLLGADSEDPQNEVDFRALTSAGALFFGGFDNPLFLFKTPFKYFKTRFLRDFFVFGTQLHFLLGWYAQKDHERLPPRYIRAATVTKMIRLVRLPRELEKACKDNQQLASTYEKRITAILTRHQLDRQRLVLFGASYSSEPGRLLHGLLMSVLSRFAACWERIYNPHVRAVLESLPKHLNLESPFPQQVQDPTAKAVLSELQQLRDSYRRYMSATAEVVRDVFPSGRVWLMQTVPRWVRDALAPFVQQ